VGCEVAVFVGVGGELVWEVLCVWVCAVECVGCVCVSGFVGM